MSSIVELTNSLKKLREARQEALTTVVGALDEILQVLIALGMQYETALEGYMEHGDYTALCCIDALKAVCKP